MLVVIAAADTWNGAWWNRRYSSTPLAASRITVSAVPASRRHLGGRRAGFSGRPVRQTCSAVIAAGTSEGGTPGPYLTRSCGRPDASARDGTSCGGA